MSAKLPHRPNLHFLRQQAKDLKTAGHAPTLSTAQLLIARTYGFNSWSALTASVARLEAAENALRRFGTTHARDFPSLRSSGKVRVDDLCFAAVSHPNPKIRWQCLQLLDHIANDTAYETFVNALRDQVVRVRKHALHALSCDRCKEEPMCADVVGPISEVALHDSNENLRLSAVRELVLRFADPRARRTLGRVAGADSSQVVRELAAKAFG